MNADAAFAAPARATSRRIARFVEYLARAAGWHVNPADPVAVATLVSAYVDACATAELDPLLVVCQLLVETDALRSPSPWLRTDPSMLDRRPDPPTMGWHATWAAAAQFHVTLLQTEASYGATTVAQVARRRGGQQYADRLLSYADSILMPQY